MMREVTGAFFGSRKLDEALEDLRAEGITGDRVRVADITGISDLHACLALSTSSPTQWITAEYGGLADSFGLADEADQITLVDASDDDILPDLYRDEDADESFNRLTRVMVSIRDEAEMRAVCDIFSRLGTDDIDAENVTA
jgi:hypothetical protein